MKTAALCGTLLIALTCFGTVADAAKTIVYAQGKGWKKWDGEFAKKTGWADLSVAYDGSSSMSNAVENTKLKNAISASCTAPASNPTQNQCIIVCYSAGCLRTLKSVKELRDANPDNVRGLVVVYATASAAGGTRLAIEATTGSLKKQAKTFGMSDPVDKDLVPDVARGSGTGQWGYVQGVLGVTMHHHAGKKDLCKFVFCGNKYTRNYTINPSTGQKTTTVDTSDVADGAVSMHSSGGFAPLVVAGVTHNTYPKFDGCLMTGKYAWRDYDDTTEIPCTGADRDHGGMPGVTARNIPSTQGYDLNLSMSEAGASSNADCTGTNCDKPTTKTCLPAKATCYPGHADWNSGSTCGCWNRALNATTYDGATCATERVNQQNWGSHVGTCTAITAGLPSTGISSPAAGYTGAINSCVGRCGMAQPTSGGWTCGCTATGTQCTDYAASNCTAFNAN